VRREDPKIFRKEMSEAEPQPAPSLEHYFVDEAGDPVLFDGRGRVLIGMEGCSRYFARNLTRRSLGRKGGGKQHCC
jgi:hypothetical protein